MAASVTSFQTALVSSLLRLPVNEVRTLRAWVLPDAPYLSKRKTPRKPRISRLPPLSSPYNPTTTDWVSSILIRHPLHARYVIIPNSAELQPKSRFRLSRPPPGLLSLLVQLVGCNSFPYSIGPDATLATSLCRFRPVADSTLPRFLSGACTNSRTWRSSLGRTGSLLAPLYLATMGLDWRIRLQ